MKSKETSAKSTAQIFRDNICTLFNLLNLLIAIALICVHAWSNLFFVPVIALNTAIGIAQELKAKHLIEKLTLLSQPNAHIERNGRNISVPVAEVMERDVLLLESGNQICADAVVTGGTIEVNESLLTGESDAVFKKKGDMLLSGSSVISGACRASVLIDRIKMFFAVTSAVGFYTAVALCLYLQNHILNIDILHLAIPSAMTMIMFLLLAVLGFAAEFVLSKTVFRKKS